MAYVHTSYEVEMIPGTQVSGSQPTALQNGVRLDATGIMAVWAPGYVPHKVMGFAVLPFATTADDAALHLSFRADISTPGTPTEIAKIVVPTTRLGHKVVYKKPTYDIIVKPGMRVDLNVTAKATAGRYGKVVMYVAPVWDDPANLTGMLSTT